MYNISLDMLLIRELLNISQDDLANKLGIDAVTINRCENKTTILSENNINNLYEFAYKSNIRINILKNMFFKDRLKDNNILLFHGSKTYIDGKILFNHGRKNNDFGQGFYTAESYEQTVSFVSSYDNSSVYSLRFDTSNLNYKKYNVDNEWMLIIAYNRGMLDKYLNNKYLKNIIDESKKYDFIIAPIADNRMFDIIDSFIRGEITDIQCKHCLAATNLGYQYVLLNEKTINNLKILDHMYLCKSEKEYYQNTKKEERKLGEDKVKLERIKYRGKGLYIDELLK